MIELNMNMFVNLGESLENVGFQSSELDFEGVEIFSIKFISESELEVLYGLIFIIFCRVKGFLKVEYVIKSELFRKREFFILKEEKEGVKLENGFLDLKISLD